ncbi:MAG: glycosyltransferase [Hyphomicrobiales bacterium]|nr:glycosyltransferase [Hyphomicrobiales bacterium]
MKILYVTVNVLGDSGANAAELFPEFAVKSPQIERTYVADVQRNRNYIKQQQLAEFLRLRHDRLAGYREFRYAFRIAKKCKDNDIDLVHVFYRQTNIPLVILLRIALRLLSAKTTIMVDHRSVNLALGRSALAKKARNLVMQVFSHNLAGNPLAVETNHFVNFKPKHIIDLGFDKLPDVEILAPPKQNRTSVWFIGSLKPRNRKTEFLIDVFEELRSRHGHQLKFDIRVAGDTKPDQAAALNENPNVIYYGRIPRARLYELLLEYPGVGMAFMNTEYHGFAPSIKFSEYAAMSYAIVASDTIGLKNQWTRMKYGNVTFARENVPEWADKLEEAVENWPESFQKWRTKNDWSYDSIYKNQVLRIYQNIVRKSK